MTYLALTFPPKIALGALRDDNWSTSVIETFGGHTKRNQNRSRSKREWDLSFAVRVVSDYRAIEAHHHQARGQAHTFPFKDYLDFAVAAADSVCTLVTGSTYQLGRTYGAVNPYVRTITRPKSGTCTFYRTRSAVTSTIAPTVDYATGRITVTGHVEGDVYTWAGEFDVPCRYASDTMPGAIVNREPGADGEHFVQCSSILIKEEFE
jgi:uncharacterized protein (TIGR02217 family)